tara:strand:+ start:60 stop:608 length:549 start_codon:yes stop_codon:yes gene_type:complete
MQKISYNLTTHFALPLLGWVRTMYEPYLINSYIRHEGVEHFQTDHIFVLVKESMDDKYQKLDKTLIAHKSHVSQYTIDEKGEYIMHVFKFEKSILPDYHLFLAGKYSQTSEAAKTLIRKSAKQFGVNYKILDRDPQLAKKQEEKIGQPLGEKDEVWSCIQDSNNIIKEVFTDDLFKTIQANH